MPDILTRAEVEATDVNGYEPSDVTAAFRATALALYERCEKAERLANEHYQAMHLFSARAEAAESALAAVVARVLAEGGSDGA